LRVVGVLLIVVGVTVVICEVWAVDDVVDPGTVSVDDAVGYINIFQRRHQYLYKAPHGHICI
jgi:hypothetical protein